MKYKFWQIDSFTTQAFSGNPAVIFIVDEFLSKETMIAIAAEMMVSETAFVKRLADNQFAIRWFTPKVEVKLCGHGTLAAAYLLFKEKLVAGETIEFSSLSGQLLAHRQGESVALSFPPQLAITSVAPDSLLKFLKVIPQSVHKTADYMLFEFDSEKTLLSINPDFSLTSQLPDLKGIIITAPADNKSYDYVCRYFAPRSGINEDPVTGSAQTALAPFWAKKLGKSTLSAYQASSRGGMMQVTYTGDNNVIIAGQCVTIFAAEMRL